MATYQENSNRSIGIVGGGNAGCRLLKLLLQSQIAKPAFVVDPKHDAPAILAAQEARIPTYTDVSSAIKGSRVDIVFELVGHPAVVQQLDEAIQGTQIRVADHDVAYTILSITEEDQHRTKEQVSAEITVIEKEINQSLDGSRNVVSQINQIMNGLQMLALNASIEAAKVGVHGKGFMVVADHMAKSVEAVRKMTHEIETMNGNIQKVSEKIDLALERLK
jgi:hypothetical protein